MSAVVVLVLAIGGDTGSPLDRVLPETVVLRIRMLALRDGMSEAEVSRWLGLKNRLPSIAAWTVSNHFVSYPIGKTHDLRLWYSLKDGPGLTHGLSEITLIARDRR
jgi:hypothetical protein